MLNVNKYRKGLLLFAVLVIIICVLAIIYTVGDENVSYDSNNVEYNYSYMLKELKGQIGVYKANETTAFDTLDVYVANLPVADQYELATGIYVKDEEKLRAIIEDYIS